MKNHWLKQEDELTFTDENGTRTYKKEDVVLMAMAEEMNQWLHRKGDDVHKYPIFLDRVCEIKHDVLEVGKVEGERIWNKLKERHSNDK